jgi:hypothetical protein
MIRQEIRSAGGVVLVFKIEGGEVEVHWRSAPGSSVWPGEPALFHANDFIELGQTLSSVEQGEAHDAAASLDMGKLAENMIDSMNKLAIMGNLKGGKNEA